MNTITAEICPTWCTTNHSKDPGGHYGPTFGKHIDTALEVDGVVGVIADLNTVNASAADLRQLAADALAAAEWIEAHR